ncbi:MAG: SpoIID/LytB domain-containing protein [candidate division KSB1 bacterium]|nr:SpoIID/LytB domain-containing protein [candidate division KSB1 bacterium]MDZ7276386.1 SpoIID/LytB domain-containing protein [candidate division KSB1 bacterium]MDZ7287662.1 SpoIID/LytB domain-containing protein [candidate division KSB1 bacterium]MDZ7299998.1 SpoIID/LytB domain-containing protein [candidate division KSB1 bacterium]MDZ7309200.1 SpoIID/LytB domain-containing protein [candidate division KSB1 bacterium]
MITSELRLKVGVLDHQQQVRGAFNAVFTLPDGRPCQGAFVAVVKNGAVVLESGNGEIRLSAPVIHCRSAAAATFTLHDVIIGIAFHWERRENQTFRGDLLLVARGDGTLAAINEISVEDYLASVISSEMSATAPLELLRAHAITSRSWLVAMLEREQRQRRHGRSSAHTLTMPGELIRWYDREDHDLYDVCADDHCQRYQGVTKIITPAAAAAVQDTAGVFLVYENEICDARFSKACGGLSENFENAWEDTPVPYLQCIADARQPHPPLRSEAEAEQWILSQPEAFCNTTDGRILQQILPSFDQETTDFFRWQVTYEREQLEQILQKKSGLHFGVLHDLVPVQRGLSGRLVKLKIVGSAQTLVVGKELEIRRWLSPSHLYSSAFIVRTERDRRGLPLRFTLHGAGWGHGVGLCQIGAAVMALTGYRAEEIVQHYFRGAELRKLY